MFHADRKLCYNTIGTHVHEAAQGPAMLWESRNNGSSWTVSPCARRATREERALSRPAARRFGLVLFALACLLVAVSVAALTLIRFSPR